MGQFLTVTQSVLPVVFIGNVPNLPHQARGKIGPHVVVIKIIVVVILERLALGIRPVGAIRKPDLGRAGEKRLVFVFAS